jgi:hypothetical protein
MAEHARRLERRVGPRRTTGETGRSPSSSKPPKLAIEEWPVPGVDGERAWPLLPQAPESGMVQPPVWWFQQRQA